MNLTSDQIDALTEIVNIGVGRAASALCDLTDRHIALRVPQITEWCGDEARSEHPALNTSVIQDFSGLVTGRALLAFPRSSGIALTRLLSEEDAGQDELEMDLAGILEEVGNIVLNGVLGSLSNLLEGNLDYSVPQLSTDRGADEIISEQTASHQNSRRTILMADTHFEVADSEIGGSLLLAFNMSQMEPLLDKLILSAEA